MSTVLARRSRSATPNASTSPAAAVASSALPESVDALIPQPLNRRSSGKSAPSSRKSALLRSESRSWVQEAPRGGRLPAVVEPYPSEGSPAARERAALVAAQLGEYEAERNATTSRVSAPVRESVAPARTENVAVVRVGRVGVLSVMCYSVVGSLLLGVVWYLSVLGVWNAVEGTGALGPITSAWNTIKGTSGQGVPFLQREVFEGAAMSGGLLIAGVGILGAGVLSVLHNLITWATGGIRIQLVQS